SCTARPARHCRSRKSAPRPRSRTGRRARADGRESRGQQGLLSLPRARLAGSCAAPWQACVDVAGIGGLRQGAKADRDLFGAHLVTIDEGMALAEHGVVTRIAELSAATDASLRHAALDGGEFER